MIFDAKKIIEENKRLIDRKTCPFRISEKTLKTFKKTCNGQGFKNHSPILEELILCFNSYANNTDSITFQVKGRNDRAGTSCSLSSGIWKEFNQNIEAQGLDRVQLLEYLMDEFNQQVKQSK